MAQPFDCRAQVPSLRDLDSRKGEFWVGNPFKFSASGQNLSAYERNGLYLNAGDRTFDNVSFVSRSDSTGDGRTVASWDITGDGMPELFVRQAGGGALRVFRNMMPRANWLKLSLRGTKSNRFGIGAKIECLTESMTVRRELNPVVNFLSQAPAAVHLGVGAATEIKSLTIQWPSGTRQEFESVPINRHLVIHEDRNVLGEFQQQAAR